MQASMTAGELGSTVAAKPKRKKRTYLKYAFFTLVALGFVWHWIWKAGGSNEWELVKQTDEIKVWTLKTPGSDLVKVKGLRVVESSMSGMVKYLEDPNTCDDVGCYDAFVMEELPTPPMHYAAYSSWKFALPFPFNHREAQTLVLHQQDPVTKEVLLDIIATPNKIKPDLCCVRLTHLHNKWRFTPVGDGKIEIELTQDMDLGGNMPGFLTSMMVPETTFKVMTDIVEHLKMDKFRNATIDYVVEP